MVDDVVALARELIDVPSVTGDEADVARLILARARSAGFSEARLDPVDGERANVVAYPDDVRVILCTHMDTVGPFIPARIEGDRLHGRGATDAKGILAAMLIAGARLRSAGVPGVGLLFLVDEETGSLGARTANETAPGSEFIVIGEPTDGTLATAHKGGLGFRLQARGVAAHSGYPDHGSSAVHALLDALGDVRRAPWGQDETLGPATVNVGTVRGGEAANVLAPTATAEVLVRLVGPAAEAEARLDDLLRAHPDVEARDVRGRDPVTFHTVPGFDAAPVAYGSDAPWLTRFGARLLHGPGSIRQAHTEDEFVDVGALRRAVDGYQRLVRALLEAPAGIDREESGP